MEPRRVGMTRGVITLLTVANKVFAGIVSISSPYFNLAVIALGASLANLAA
jgi:hypothetical protein